MVSEALNTLDEVFHKYLLKKDKIFKNRDLLNHKFIPENLINRDQQREIIYKAIKRGYEKGNSFILCYGSAGTGKTALIINILNNLSRAFGIIGVQKPITTIINCRQTTTKYRILANLVQKIGQTVPSRCNFTKLFQRFKKEADSKNQFIIIVLDEIDKIFNKSTKKTNNISNFLLKMNTQLKTTRFCIIGLTNNLNFKKCLSSEFLSDIHVVLCEFFPYNANELKLIIKERILLAFYPGIVSEEVINLIAALGAKSGGDVRYSLGLLQKAGELAERNGEQKVLEEHVRKAHKIFQAN